MLVRETDIFRAGKSLYRITEPLINFYESIMRPAWPSLEAGQAPEVWAQSAHRFDSQATGPQFEALCREFVLTSTTGTFAFPLGQVGSGIVTDPAARQRIEIDVAVTEPGSGASGAKVLLLGEAKWERLWDCRILLTCIERRSY